ncbi:MAG TPA: M23 family metallopeptidase, partial [Candidatus Caenarcaniphilales bacterium]
QPKAPVGVQILVPPFNGIQVVVPSGQSLKDVAATYKVRPDVLFEVNGCQTSPQVVFVPGVNWSPLSYSEDPPVKGEQPATPGGLGRYPLPSVVPITSGYGWRVDPASGNVVFHSGVDLEAPPGTLVMAVASGTVAFAGKQGNYGNLVVVNQAQGRQTRYAQLASISVSAGQRVKPGDPLGTVGATGLAERPHLHFELRANSAIGWVAQDPTNYLRQVKAQP